MKKRYLYSIALVMLLIFAVVGVTYAFFVSEAASNQNLETSSKKFEVIYTGGQIPLENIKLKPSIDKSGGINTSVNIMMAQDSALAKGTLYINIEKLTSNLANDGFIWEVYGSDGTYETGTFVGYNDTDNNIINIVENFPITYDNKTFTVYLWLDGNNPYMDNRILDAEFDCYIGTKTEQFAGTVIKQVVYERIFI